MNVKLEHSASIEQYLSGEMSASAKQAFRKEVSLNTSLARELRLSRTIDDALLREDVIDLRRKLLTEMRADQNEKAEVPVIKLQTRKWWYAAASLLVLCTLAATLYLQRSPNISNDELFSNYYNSENIIDQTRGGQDLVEAVVKFQQKDFATASTLFKTLLTKDNDNIAVRFYYGISNIETKNYDNAISAFNTIISQNDNLYIEHAEWYLGLCYLKSNQREKAINQFQSVASNPDNFHRKEAADLLKKLKSN
jgi:tetratricopeptide (TPR) repeat protein